MKSRFLDCMVQLIEKVLMDIDHKIFIRYLRIERCRELEEYDGKLVSKDRELLMV